MIHDNIGIRLLYSGFPYRETSKDMRALIDRCNKGLYQQEIKKSKQFKYYGFDRLSTGCSRSSVDKFKTSFGGMDAKEYNSLQIGVI